jgi:hypothetical protein
LLFSVVIGYVVQDHYRVREKVREPPINKRNLERKHLNEGDLSGRQQQAESEQQKGR